MFLADDQGYGDLGIYQHNTGSPICAPARASFLTGRYNHRVTALGVESNRGLDRIALGEQTLADRFRAGGYGTGMVGKWHNGLHDLRYHPNGRGFDEFAGFLNGGWVTGTGSLNTTASRCGRPDAT